MAEHDPDARRLAELETRLRKARGPDAAPPQESSQSIMGIGFQLVAELVTAVIVGGGIGWGLDYVFGTSPILLIVMFLIGAAAGMRNVMRAARENNARTAGVPLIKDDGED